MPILKDLFKQHLNLKHNYILKKIILKTLFFRGFFCFVNYYHYICYMKNILLTITLILTTISVNAQSKVYNLNNFYRFEVKSGLNPLVEYDKNREKPLNGIFDTVTIKFDEVNNVVISNNKSLNKVDTFPIIGKSAPNPLVEIYDVFDTDGKVSKYVLSHFPNEDVLVYFLQYGESKTQAWSSLHKN